MKILVLGGTQFLGRHIVDAARGAEHEVTIVHRGQHPAHRADLQEIKADRDGDLAALCGKKWDVAIDVAAYVPKTVRTSTGVLRGAVERYVFVSTVSVFADLGKNERTLAAIDDATAARFDAMTTDEAKSAKDFGEAYGAMKVRAEGIVREAFGDRALVVRPGLIVGPHDTTDRFTYWPSRVARGGEVLAPEFPEFPVRFVDVRDLASFVVRAVETAASGTYEVFGARSTFGALLDAARAVSGSDARVTWVPEEHLLAQKVAPWSDLPLWIPRADTNGLLITGSDERALAEGLTLRAIEETVRDTLAWDRTRAPGARRAGLDAKREAEVLAAWHKHKSVMQAPAPPA